MPYLTVDPIAVEELVRAVSAAQPGRHGAFVTFLGIVRADATPQGTIAALSYEAYAEMAESELHTLVHDVQRRWPHICVALKHRLGHLAVGEISLAVIVAAPHRAEAYAASHDLVERLKQHVPIWKQEHATDGTRRWAQSSESVPMNAVSVV